MMKAATWNVNSVAVRKERLLAFLERERPDVLCLQELKGLDEGFPSDAVASLGYTSTVYGQKSYNGVAILSKQTPSDTWRSFDDGDEDVAARFLVAKINGVTIMSAYVPNGAFVGSEKFAYKLAWLKRLRLYLDKNFKPADKLLLMGDFNIAPRDIDVHDPKAWHEKILCSTPERRALKQIEAFGLTDLGAHLNPTKQEFTWWDYRMLGFPKNLGLRIDLILASAPLLDVAMSVRVDRDERKGDKPSDHAPVVATFDF